MKDTIELKKKIQRVEELNRIIQIHGGKTLITEQRQEIENWKAKLEFRLDELVLECKLKEADIRIGVFEEIVKILNTKHV